MLGSTITIELEGNIWINSALLPTRWPDVMKMFAGVDFDRVIEIPAGLKEAIEDIVPFCPDKKFPKIILNEEGVHTADGDHQAMVELTGLHHSIWRAEPLLNLLTGAETVGLKADFSTYPKPSPWVRGDNVRGVIVGLKT